MLNQDLLTFNSVLYITECYAFCVQFTLSHSTYVLQRLKGKIFAIENHLSLTSSTLSDTLPCNSLYAVARSVELFVLWKTFN